MELTLFERAASVYRAAGDARGEGEAQFWVGCYHQVVTGDDGAADTALRLARDLAEQAGDRLTSSYVLRHLGIAEHEAGRLEQARELLEESTALRRALGFDAGVAANLVGLAYLAAADGADGDDAASLLDEADTLARDAGADAIRAQVTEARTHLAPG